MSWSSAKSGLLILLGLAGLPAAALGQEADLESQVADAEAQAPPVEDVPVSEPEAESEPDPPAEPEPAPVEPAPAPQPTLEAPRLGGDGESCRATSDCQAPLVCRELKCVDPAAQQEAAAPLPPEEEKEEPKAGPFERVRFLMGAGFTLGPDWIWYGGNEKERATLVNVDLKVGVLLRRAEYSLVYSPWWYFSGPTKSHSLRLDRATYYPFGSSFYFATRYALGGVFGGSGPRARRGLLTGIDLLNLGYVLKGLMLEANLGKLRMLTDFDSFELGLLFGVTVHYGVPQ